MKVVNVKIRTCYFLEQIENQQDLLLFVSGNTQHTSKPNK